MLLPFYETPDWCLNKSKQFNSWYFFMDCDRFAYPRRQNGFPYSNTTMIHPRYLGIADIVCVIYLIFVRWSKRRFQIRYTHIQKSKDVLFGLLLLGMAID